MTFPLKNLNHISQQASSPILILTGGFVDQYLQLGIPSPLRNQRVDTLLPLCVLKDTILAYVKMSRL